MSRPIPVSMADSWFSMASPDHFWFQRRLDVLIRLACGMFSRETKVLEIGCGNGVLQRQLDQTFGVQVDGCDLNEMAMRHSVAQCGRLYCYDIHSRADDLRSVYDVVLLFDVIEHIQDDVAFLKSAMHHLRPGGHLIINVPADPQLFSAYDIAAGHVRRYTVNGLRELSHAVGLEWGTWTYWGISLYPLLCIRKWWLRGKANEQEIIKFGFDSRGSTMNACLRMLSRLECVPNHALGTSLMLMTRKP